MTPAEQVAKTLPPIKRCHCGMCFDAESWARLPYVGIMDDGVDRLELRNCACSSTLAIEAAA